MSPDIERPLLARLAPPPPPRPVVSMESVSFDSISGSSIVTVVRHRLLASNMPSRLVVAWSSSSTPIVSHCASAACEISKKPMILNIRIHISNLPV